MFNYINEQEELKTGKLVGHIALALVVIIVLLGTFGTVGAGERGVRTTFSAVTGGIAGEGLYFKLPFIQKVVKMDVRIQKDEVVATAASADLQNVSARVAVNFHLNVDKVAFIFQGVGENYKARLIDPSVQEAVKSATAKYTAEQLITKREAVREDIKTLLSGKLISHGIEIDEFNIIDFDFSDSFNVAIEAKVTAEQNALAAKNKLEQVKFEAEQKVAEAKGKAEAITIEANALRSNPQVLELRALEKWNGVLPQVTGGAVPFINLK